MVTMQVFLVALFLVFATELQQTCQVQFAPEQNLMGEETTRNGNKHNVTKAQFWPAVQ